MPENSPRAFCKYCGTRILIGRMGTESVRCSACDGFGRVDMCRACNGSGTCSWSTRSPGGSVGFSAHCEDGICSVCHGSGRHRYGGCPACNGTGKCPQCLGTTKCQACHGLGNFPSPGGQEECGVCHGAGVIDAGKPAGVAAVLTDKCPDCGKPIHDNNTQCPHCGFVRRKCPQCDELWVPRALYCQKCGFGKDPDRK